MKYFKITELDSCKYFYISSWKPDDTAERIANFLGLDTETYKVEEATSEEFETAMEDGLQEPLEEPLVWGFGIGKMISKRR